MGNVGHHRAASGEHGTLRRENIIHAELVHEPLFLRRRVVRAACHRPGVADRSRELGLPASNHARDHRLGEVRVQLVVAARLHIEHGGLAARVVGQRESELGCGVLDVDVFPARDQRGGAPPGHAQIGRDGGGEISGIRKDGDGALLQCLGRVVSAKRAADTHAIPGIGHAETVAPENVDAVVLAKGANFARVMHGKLFGDDEYLAQFLIHTDQLRHAVARAGRRQVDHAAIEAMAVRKALAHVVVDRNVAGRRLQHLAATSRGRTEDDVAAGIRVTHRRHFARFAAQDVEHAHAVVGRCDLRE